MPDQIRADSASSPKIETAGVHNHKNERHHQSVDMNSSSTTGTPSAERAQQFGRLLRRMREASGLTQTALAEQMQQSVSYLSLIESGRRRPTAKIVRAVKEALALSREQEQQLVRAAGLPTDELESAIGQLMSAVEAQVGASEEVDRLLMRSDLRAIVHAWKDLLAGKQDMRHGQFDTARGRFQVGASHEELTPTLIAYNAANLADVCEKQGELERARAELNHAQTRMQALPPDWAVALRGEIDAQEGMVALRMGNYGMARKLMTEAQAQYAKLLDEPEARAAATVGFTKSYNRLALVALMQGEPATARSYCKTAEAFLDEISTSPTDRRRLRLKALLAWAAMQEDDFPEAQRLHNEVRQAYEKLHDDYGVAKNWLYLGDDYRAQIEAALNEDKLLEDTSRFHGQWRRKILTKRLLPVKQVLDEAEVCYRNAARGLEDLHERILLGRAYRSLGDILRLKGLVGSEEYVYPESLRLLTRALALESQIGQERRLPTIYESLAKLEWDFGSLAAAAQYYVDAIQVLDNPVVSSADASALRLRKRCQRGLNILRQQLDEHSNSDAMSPLIVLSGPEADRALRWRQVCERLIAVVASAVLEDRREPFSLSDVDFRWLEQLYELEQQQGPRLLALNEFSISVSPALPVAFAALEEETEVTAVHRQRHKRFLADVRAVQAGHKQGKYRDVCHKGTIDRGLKNPASRPLYLRQVEGALSLLREAPKGYSLYVSELKLPLGFVMKGQLALIEVPGEQARFFGYNSKDVTEQAPTLCYRIYDEPNLLKELSDVFEALVALCEEERDLAIPTEDWLRNLAETYSPLAYASGE